MRVMNSFTWHVFHSIVDEVRTLLDKRTFERRASAASPTVAARDVQTAVRLVFPRQLCMYAISEGTKAYSKGTDCCHPRFASSSSSSSSSGGGGGGDSTMTRTSLTARAGLQLSVARVTSALRNALPGRRLAAGTAVYLAGVLEYAVAELLELGGNAAKDFRVRRVVVRHLLLALRGDEELDEMTRSATLPHGGVIPHIHKALVAPLKKNKAA